MPGQARAAAPSGRRRRAPRAHGRMDIGRPGEAVQHQRADRAAVVAVRLGPGISGTRPPCAARDRPAASSGIVARRAARRDALAGQSRRGRARAGARSLGWSRTTGRPPRVVRLLGFVDRLAGREVALFYWLLRSVLVGPLLRLFFRPWVEGLENVPDDGPAILASNHLSFSDSIFLPLVVPRHITFLAKSEYFTGKGVKGRLTAFFFKGIGPGADRPLRRLGQPGRDRHRAAGPRRGQLLGIYPEGTRSPDGQLYRGQDRRGPDGAGGRRPGHPGRDDRHREDPAARQGLPEDHAGRASRSASRWTSPGTRAWRATGSSCARSPTRSCTS